MLEKINSELSSHVEVLNRLSKSEDWKNTLEEIARICITTLKNGGKILLCGNGGSAADAQHIAAELSGRYLRERDPLFAEALHVNTSYLTAVGNDFDFSEVFARAVLAKGKPGDILIGLSTSGNSRNVMKAFEIARKKNLHTVLFTGAEKNDTSDVDFCLQVPSTHTPRIQEAHILFGHMLCLLIEDEIF